MPDRVYVSVTSDFDATGYMQPRTILWPDGRVFRIEEIRAVHPDPPGRDSRRDCYTVVIRGHARSLFFERSKEHSACRPGRWYVVQS